MKDLGRARTTALRVAAAILLCAAATIAGAWIFQALGYAPCELCLKERIPYYVAIALAILTVVIAARGPRRLLQTGFVLLLLTLIASTAFGIYHAGVEWKFWPGPSACTGSYAKAASMHVFLEQLRHTKVVACDAVAIRILGLSLAGWNAVISLMLAALAAFGLRTVIAQPRTPSA